MRPWPRFFKPPSITDRVLDRSIDLFVGMILSHCGLVIVVGQSSVISV